MRGYHPIFRAPIAVGIAVMASLGAAETLPMYEAAYRAGRIRIGAEFRSAQAACRARLPTPVDVVCLQAARADRRAAIVRLKDDTDVEPLKP